MSWRRRLLVLALDRIPGLTLRLGSLAPQDLGRAAEGLVAQDLVRRGLRVLGRRVPGPGAELDLVAWDGAVLVAVEVKAGRLPSASDLSFRPGLRLSARRLAAQRRSLEGLARRIGGQPRTRIDLVEVILLPGSRRPKLVYWPDRRTPLT